MFERKWNFRILDVHVQIWLTCKRLATFGWGRFCDRVNTLAITKMRGWVKRVTESQPFMGQSSLDSIYREPFVVKNFFFYLPAARFFPLKSRCRRKIIRNWQSLGPMFWGRYPQILHVHFQIWFKLFGWVQLGDLWGWRSETRSLAIAKRPCDCWIILNSGSYTKAL